MSSNLQNIICKSERNFDILIFAADRKLLGGAFSTDFLYIMAKTVISPSIVKFFLRQTVLYVKIPVVCLERNISARIFQDSANYVRGRSLLCLGSTYCTLYPLFTPYLVLPFFSIFFSGFSLSSSPKIKAHSTKIGGFYPRTSPI